MSVVHILILATSTRSHMFSHSSLGRNISLYERLVIQFVIIHFLITLCKISFFSFYSGNLKTADLKYLSTSIIILFVNKFLFLDESWKCQHFINLMYINKWIWKKKSNCFKLFFVQKISHLDFSKRNLRILLYRVYGKGIPTRETKMQLPKCIAVVLNAPMEFHDVMCQPFGNSTLLSHTLWQFHYPQSKTPSLEFWNCEIQWGEPKFSGICSFT